MDERTMEETTVGDDLVMETFDLSEHLVSAENVANDVDLLSMILLRVPAKSLVKFKCISKHWLSLISDSKFCNNHTRKNLNLSISGLYIDSYPLVDIKTRIQDAKVSLPMLGFLTSPSGAGAVLLDSSNGLMLCSRGTELILCNPVTQKFKVVSSLSHHSREYGYMFLYFNPMESPQYKIVTIDVDCTPSHDPIGPWISQYPYYINIYSSESGIWNKNHLGRLPTPLSNKVLCDGAIYWIAGRINLMRFDIKAENLTTIQMPPDFVIVGNNSVPWLGEYAGNLLIAVEALDKLRIVEMHMHHSRCTIKYNINSGLIIDSTIMTHFREVYGISYNRNVFLLMGGDKETLTLLFADYGRIISYNLKSNYHQIIQDLPCDVCGIIKLSPGLIRVHKFTASLAVI